MKFGAKEVMVIAALTFGVMAAGCAMARTTPVVVSPLRQMDTGVHECKICISQSLPEFRNPGALEVLKGESLLRPIMNSPVAGGPGAAGFDYCSEPVSWSLSLPGFFK